MKHRHILVAIHALEDKKSQIREKISYYAKFHDYHNTESREVCRLREAEVNEALHEFKALLPAPIAKVNACLASAAPADPIPAPESTPHFSPEIIEEMRSALRNNVRASDSAVKLMQRIADGSVLSPGWLQSLTNLQKRRDIARLAAKVFDEAYPEEK